MDNYVLYSPQASAYNLGSWTNFEEGPDFNPEAVYQPEYSESPLVDGGRLLYQTSGVRRLRFPLVLPSGGAGLALTALEAALTVAANPNGYIDLQPEAVPSAEAVRFDVVAGRWLPAYGIREHAVGRRRGTLEVDVQPFGYWPTQILLASAASIGLPGFLAVPGASVIGDAPGLAVVNIIPTVPSFYTGVEWFPDMVAWSLGGPSGFTHHLRPASLTAQALNAASLAGDVRSVSSQALVGVLAQTSGWRHRAFYTIPTSIGTFYRGRHRLYAWLKLVPSYGLPIQVAGDTAFSISDSSLASAGPVATLAPHVSSGIGTGGFGAQPSNSFALVDLGEISMPPAASGAEGDVYVRLWANVGTSNVGVGTVQLNVGGLELLPLADAAGVMPRGLAYPTIGLTNSYTSPRFDGIRGEALQRSYAAAPAVIQDAYVHYRGVLPRVGATTRQLTLLAGDRRIDLASFAAADKPLIRSGPNRAAVSVHYRPRFSFLKGL